MTDDETFTAICADFPFDSAALESLYDRLSALVGKYREPSTGDGTLKNNDLARLRVLLIIMRDMVDAMRMIETDGDPDEFIPF